MLSQEHMQLLQRCIAGKCHWSLFFFELLLPLLPLIESTASGRAYPLWLKAIKSGRNTSISTPLQHERPLPTTEAGHKAYMGIAAGYAAPAVVEGPQWHGDPDRVEPMPMHGTGYAM